jgi:GNAT superfamily N-acetyltransferase
MTSRQIEVTRTYLEMRSANDLRREGSSAWRVRIESAQHCPASFYRYLYAEVGRAHHWRDRRDWTDDQIRSHLSRAEVALWVMYFGGCPAGWFELLRCEDRSVEIAYFGLLPDFIGRGLGKYMLSEAVDRAWAAGAERVWLHTCTLDGPAALPNYRKRGFTPFKEERYITLLQE